MRVAAHVRDATDQYDGEEVEDRRQNLRALGVHNLQVLSTANAAESSSRAGIYSSGAMPTMPGHE